MIPMQNDSSLLLPDDDPPIRADARRNRELILVTAQELFAKNGVDAVSMTAIADEAGVGKGTLYRHFTNKADLCYTLLDEDMRELQGRILKRLRDEADTPLENLKWFLAEIYGFVRRNEPMFMAEMDVRGLELDHSAHIWWRQTIIGLLDRLMPGDDVRYYADMLYVMVDVRTIRFQRLVLNYTDDYIIEKMTEAIDRIAG